MTKIIIISIVVVVYALAIIMVMGLCKVAGKDPYYKEGNN